MGLALLSLQALYLDTMHALEDLLTSLLHRNMTPQGLQTMVEVCRGLALPWGGGWGLLAVGLGPPPALAGVQVRWGWALTHVGTWNLLLCVLHHVVLDGEALWVPWV